MHALRYNKTWQLASSSIIGNFFFQFLKSQNILSTFRRQFPITTSTPVTISIILNCSQLDDGSLIPTERNEQAVKRIQKKMMRARSTLDTSQSNNISCYIWGRCGQKFADTFLWLTVYKSLASSNFDSHYISILKLHHVHRAVRTMFSCHNSLCAFFAFCLVCIFIFIPKLKCFICSFV